MTDEKAPWEPTTQPVIVCAANRLPDSTIILGTRHWDSLMREHYRAIYGKNVHKRTWWHKILRWLQSRPQPSFTTVADEGFIDQFMRYYTREEAMVVARQNDQIIVPDHQLMASGALHSEDLY